jgi:uncharacterized membrane protein
MSAADPTGTPGATERWRRRLRGLLAAFFMAMGLLHFVLPGPFEAIVPPWVPYPYAMVLVSGAFELGLGLAVLPERTRPWAGVGLVLLLLAVFPANVHMALHEVPPEAPPPRWLVWGRLPLQAVFIAWAWWCTRPDAGRRPR